MRVPKMTQVRRQNAAESKRERKPIRRCNLCNHAFRTHSRFDRFCEGCKRESELYHFAECLPVSA